MIFPPFEQFQQASQQQQQQQLVVVSHGDEACLISPAEHYPGQGICSYLCKSWRLAPLFCHSAGEQKKLTSERTDGRTNDSWSVPWSHIMSLLLMLEVPPRGCLSILKKKSSPLKIRDHLYDSTVVNFPSNNLIHAKGLPVQTVSKYDTQTYFA